MFSIMGASASAPTVVDEPCQKEFEEYLKCVREHPQGLKADDCDKMRDVYRLCMNPPAEKKR